MTQRFESMRVLITGAGGGMGRALAQRFAAEGASLLLTDVDEDALNQAAEELRSKRASCVTYRVDLAVEAEIHALAAQVAEAHPRLDVLVNNAGLAYGEISYSFDTLNQAKWLRYFAINSVAPVLLAQALRAPLTAAKGVVLNITSMASYLPGTAYGVTKAALNAMTFGMASSFGAEGVRVNAIAPGLMETPAAVSSLPAETYARVQAQQLLKVPGRAEDIAALAAFLASEDARFITGEIISCDAGNRLRGWRG